MAGKKKPQISGKAPNNTKFPEFGTLEYWRNQARQMAGDENDPWRISEIATVLNEVAKLFGGHWQNINTIMDGNTDQKMNVNFGITIDRSDSPPEVSCKISYNQKFGENLTGKVPDPDQTELPLQTSSTVPEPEQDENPVPT